MLLKDMYGVEHFIALYGDSLNICTSLFSHPSIHDKQLRECISRRSSSFCISLSLNVSPEAWICTRLFMS